MKQSLFSLNKYLICGYFARLIEMEIMIHELLLSSEKTKDWFDKWIDSKTNIDLVQLIIHETNLSILIIIEEITLSNNLENSEIQI